MPLMAKRLASTARSVAAKGKTTKATACESVMASSMTVELRKRISENSKKA